MNLKNNLLLLCEKRGWTLAKLARAASIPTQTLHGWTVGRKPINLDQIKNVATVLEVSIHQLIFGEPDPFETSSEEILKEIFTGDIRVTLHRIERHKRTKRKA